jgi:hypothetical protein
MILVGLYEKATFFLTVIDLFIIYCKQVQTLSTADSRTCTCVSLQSSLNGCLIDTHFLLKHIY